MRYEVLIELKLTLLLESFTPTFLSLLFLSCFYVQIQTGSSAPYYFDLSLLSEDDMLYDSHPTA